MRAVRMGNLRAEMRKSANGIIHVRSTQPLADYPRSIIDCLRRWAAEAPDRMFLADRGAGGAWRKVTYAQALEKTRAIAQHLLDLDLSADRPIAILSGKRAGARLHGARRDDGRHSLCAGVSGLFADFDGFRQAQAYFRSRDAGAGVYDRWQALRERAEGRHDAGHGADLRPRAGLRLRNPAFRRDRHHDADGCRGGSRRRRHARYRRQIPLHLRLDRHAEGGHQYAAHALAATR